MQLIISKLGNYGILLQPSFCPNIKIKCAFFAPSRKAYSYIRGLTPVLSSIAGLLFLLLKSGVSFLEISWLSLMFETWLTKERSWELLILEPDSVSSRVLTLHKKVQSISFQLYPKISCLDIVNYNTQDFTRFTYWLAENSMTIIW